MEGRTRIDEKFLLDSIEEMESTLLILLSWICMCTALPSVTWYAPFLSGGGYSSEAISFALEAAKSSADKFNFGIVQFAEQAKPEFIEGLPKDTAKDPCALWTIFHNIGPKASHKYQKIGRASFPPSFSPT